MSAVRTGRAARVLVTSVLTACLAASCTDAVVGPARLVDVTADVGLDWTHGAFRWGTSADPAAMMGGGACWLDADGDGWLDLYLVSTWSQDEHARWVAEGGLPTSTLWRNDGGAGFTDVGADVGATLAVRGLGCLAADLDGDGHTDLYVTTDRSNVLLWNDGDGTFTEDDGSAGLDLYGWQSTAAAADVDGDGRLDLFVGGYVDLNTPREGVAEGFPRSHRPVGDVLLRNTGPGDGARAVFASVPDAGLDPDGARYTLGSTFTDVDGDGDLDLLVANDTDPNRLYRNDSVAGSVRFVDIADVANADDSGSGMGVGRGDVDQDGLDDVVVTNLGSQGHTLLLGSGDGEAFTDGRDVLGVPAFGDGLTGWGASLADIDGDGTVEVLVGNGAIPVQSLPGDARPLRAWRFDGAALVDATTSLGLDEVGAQNARAVAVADVDNDADPDVLVTSIGGQVLLLATEGGGAGASWLVIAPEGGVPGTTITVTLDDGRVLRRELRAGSSYLSTEDPRGLFGLGPAAVGGVTVRWPDGAVAELGGVASGTVVTVERPG